MTEEEKDRFAERMTALTLQAVRLGLPIDEENARRIAEKAKDARAWYVVRCVDGSLDFAFTMCGATVPGSEMTPWGREPCILDHGHVGEHCSRLQGAPSPWKTDS